MANSHCILRKWYRERILTFPKLGCSETRWAFQMKTCDLLCGGLHGGWSELERVSYVVTVPVSRKTLVLLRRKHDALVELLLRHRISLISVFPKNICVSQRVFIPFNLETFGARSVGLFISSFFRCRCESDWSLGCVTADHLECACLGYVASAVSKLHSQQPWTVCWVYWVPKHLRIQLQLPLSCNCDQRKGPYSWICSATQVIKHIKKWHHSSS